MDTDQDERRVSKMLWSMVSKAAERSRRHRHIHTYIHIRLMAILDRTQVGYNNKMQ